MRALLEKSLKRKFNPPITLIHLDQLKIIWTVDEAERALDVARQQAIVEAVLEHIALGTPISYTFYEDEQCYLAELSDGSVPTRQTQPFYGCPQSNSRYVRWFGTGCGAINKHWLTIGISRSTAIAAGNIGWEYSSASFVSNPAQCPPKIPPCSSTAQLGPLQGRPWRSCSRGLTNNRPANRHRVDFRESVRCSEVQAGECKS